MAAGPWGQVWDGWRIQERPAAVPWLVAGTEGGWWRLPPLSALGFGACSAPTSFTLVRSIPMLCRFATVCLSSNSIAPYFRSEYGCASGQFRVPSELLSCDYAGPHAHAHARRLTGLHHIHRTLSRVYLCSEYDDRILLRLRMGGGRSGLI